MTELPKELQEAMDDLLDMEPGDLLDTIEAQNNHIEAMQKREEVLTQTIKKFVNMMEEILQEDTRDCGMIDSEANGYFLHRTESIVKSPQYQALKSIKE